MASLSLTENAAKKVQQLISSQGEPEENLMLRLTIQGGGCSGFQYNFSLDNKQQNDDVIIETAGIKLVIDNPSLELVNGAEIDYVEELIGASFRIKNTNASSACGCGSSFSL